MARVLVVDDEPQVRSVLVQMVGKLGHNAVTATNGKHALQQLEAMPVDLVIMDLIMPESEGIETTAIVKRRWPDVKILAISGGGRHAPEPYLAMAAALGADATLAKPFECADLAAAIRELLAPVAAPSAPASGTADCS
ncbi:MAG TPA: response regulator [Vicinamibacterales bacterium]|jgi:CheY-like chemotaxis protein